MFEADFNKQLDIIAGKFWPLGLLQKQDTPLPQPIEVKLKIDIVTQETPEGNKMKSHVARAQIKITFLKSECAPVKGDIVTTGGKKYKIISVDNQDNYFFQCGGQLVNE